ncbi:hypothetical protein K491DRAFT_713961 [Lophiostoma macrostomum CBS 122681]|uniref:Uncharacterized protein n=1 Tax=Lophiostoma macrostomum CBS 122681 TaxID=1314788 RepID=A0A6A6TE67_9PLEO|nr:hypothetical protein K491DRAFT_713961 [Lophiostoma macrostomum CBS 122681]
MGTTESSNIPPFSVIPLEIREQVYFDVLTDPAQGTQLLRTCREILAEGNKFLFQRPLVFRRQQALYNWLEHARNDYLNLVTNITLELQDVDLRPLLHTMTANARTPNPPRLQAWDLHEQEVQRWHQAMNKIPNVKVLTLRVSSDHQSHLYRKYVDRILEILSLVWPNLQSLNLEGNFHHQNLTFASSLTELHSLSFDGFSTSEATDTADILSSLGRLERLSLVSQHAILTPTNNQHGFSSKRQSLSGDALRTIRPIAYSSLSEQQHAASPALFFTPEVLEALYEHPTLKGLSISMSRVPNAEILEAMGNYLQHSAIEHLEVDFPDLDATILKQHGLLSGCLKDFWVRISSMTNAFDILCSIFESRKAGDIPTLGRVVLVREAWIAGDKRHIKEKIGEEHKGSGTDFEVDTGPETTDLNKSIPTATDEQNVRRMITQLNNLGIKVLWRTESI